MRPRNNWQAKQIVRSEEGNWVLSINDVVRITVDVSIYQGQVTALRYDDTEEAAFVEVLVDGELMQFCESYWQCFEKYASTN